MYLRPLTPQPHHSVSKHSCVEINQSLLRIHMSLYIFHIYLYLLCTYTSPCHMTMLHKDYHQSKCISIKHQLTSAPQMVHEFYSEKCGKLDHLQVYSY